MGLTPVRRIFTNARVYTFDSLGATGQAIAVTGDRIAAVGSEADIAGLAGPDTQTVDLGGRTLVPGLVDAHNHLVWYGLEASRAADLSGSTSIEEVLERLHRFRTKNPTIPWLLGQRFDHELFSESRWITRDDLDRVSRDAPVAISRLCLHAIVANSAALRPVEHALSPEERRTGILKEESADHVWNQIPDPTESELEAAILWSLEDARRVGLCGVHSQFSSPREIEILHRLHQQGRLPLRVRVQFSFSLLDHLTSLGLHTGSGDEMLRIGSAKLFCDGAMGARTAAMKQPFSDDPGNCGDLLLDDKQLAPMLREAQARGCQCAIHAIGDLGVGCSLSAIEEAMRHGNADNALRHRVEHATQVDRGIVERMARLNVPAVVQPQFVITDFWTCERVGTERYCWSNAFASMLRYGVKLAMGSDCPVERLDPIELLERAVNREPRSLEQCLSVEQTLRAYSLGSAYAGWAENSTGTLQPGKLADMAVLSEDPFEMDCGRLSELRVDSTIIGGDMR